MPDISLVMPCYNRSHDLRKILQSYERQVGDGTFEIIAVDDGSRDATFEILSSYQPGRYSLQAVKQPENQGPAAARNHGVELATSPVVLFVGDDILPDPYLIRGHLASHRRHPAPQDAILGRIQWPDDLPVNTLMQHIDGMGAEQFSYFYFKDESEYDYRHFYTANVSIKTNFLKQAHKMFDTDFQYAAFEDVELSYRLAQRGMRILYSFHPLAYHYHYHTIWSFSLRQYRAGLMACVIVRKHPKTWGRIMGRWPFYIFKWFLKTLASPKPVNISDKHEALCLRWLSDHEWSQHEILDHVYLIVLKYYFVKGLIFGWLGETELARRVNQACAQEMLARTVGQL